MACITGAGNGIGEAYASTFARSGARVVLPRRQHSPLDAVAPRIGGAGAGVRRDVSDPDATAANTGMISAFVSHA